MTKEEAIISMQQGKKITHNYFSDNEFMFMPNPKANRYQFEDGVSVSAIEFWSIGNSEGWNDGYSEFKTK